MTFSKSNLNFLSESLFTELTADQAQTIEGGKQSDRTDESFFIVGDRLFNNEKPFGMKANSVVHSDTSKPFNSSTKFGSFDRNGTDGSQSIAFFKKAFKKLVRG
jgi:hypothetical protein